jgi:predicted transcriptional regulator
MERQESQPGLSPPANTRSGAVVAPEVAARIMARRAAGELLADIGRDLHLTRLEVVDVLRAAEHRVGAAR